MEITFEQNVPYIIEGLEKTRSIYQTLLTGLDEATRTWKPEPDLWCLLEIVCHLYDEEREDFRARVKHMLTSPAVHAPSIDPVGWVTERKYMEQDYNEMLKAFLDERDQSVIWLKSLENANWAGAYNHPRFGPLTAKMFLTNWLAHDYLHIRQIMSRKYHYLHQKTGIDLEYAGGW
ncbi:MAG: DinB family protein [Bacteroidota bacterium]